MKKGEEQKFVNIAGLGNYTKNAVEDFEKSIVNQKDYLEKVKENVDSQVSNKFK